MVSDHKGVVGRLTISLSSCTKNTQFMILPGMFLVIIACISVRVDCAVFCTAIDRISQFYQPQPAA
ncbi:hypothetical protein B9K09_04550 [Pseudomonas sp. M30-35]|nr:hypothetical protein B9K09_04550 [Pseudomonas sp. M30-35]